MSTKKFRLADIASIKTGKLDSNAAVENGEYPFFTCSQQTYLIDTPAFDTKAVLLGGNNAAGIFPLKYYEGEFNAYQRTYVIESLDSEILNIRFLFYLLRPALSYFQSISIGVATQYLTKKILDNYTINLPPISEQQRITSILSAYDDRLENNQRRIELIEQAARLLYREWFVHLRFPGHEHVRVVDGVPEGWKIVPFPEVVDFKEGPGLRKYQYREVGIPFLNIRVFNNDEIDLSKAQFLDEIEVETKYQHFLLEEDDHVVSSSGTLGRLVTVRKCHLPVMLNTSLIRMRPKGVMKKWHLKAYLNYGDFIDQAKSMATGAAQLNYGPSHLKNMRLLIPNKYLIELSDEHLGAYYNQIKILHDTNLQLAKARDFLLPKLMNGEIAV